ncbi:coenzyme F420-reducing hydrogenase beta subunit [Ruminiclostridium sufflavum DSM 19573]|uniref:Coenzyme F420-reducing hydrogenase beta subunit n=2 Tax=Ruminiclostridium TaxID=1508657 RepID=A0A318XHA4_9FIRM|nr:Coenzyme F420 hydrogenase/dehydrogenase, beta subunit C-terminal domain [Ruminiclostridium sufflavum]PYG86555.1 coenzyme F420-reducing hydrogenase beta subunit [Ruminiclostridium sufflavum DSM 19573]
MACYSACKTGAISITTDCKGFYIPEVNSELCLNCDKCKIVCPSLNELSGSSDFQQQTFACWHKDEKIRMISTSGGVFSGLVRYVLSKQGVAFGVRFDDEFRAVYEEADNLKKLKYFRGSKYIQSYVGDVYKTVKQRLENNVIVLFTGTPCQNAGLRSYLGKAYDNLITVDIICHSVPSPLVFSDYIEYIRKTIDSDITEINFRYKKPSWTVYSMRIDFRSRKPYIADYFTDPYLIGFSKDYFSRDCCYECKYTKLNRQSDITIADFWGYVSDDRRYRNDEKGISLVLINSEKGSKVFSAISAAYIVRQKSIQEVMKNKSLYTPYKKNPLSDDFWKEYLEHRDFELVKNKYFYKRRGSLKHRLSRFIDDYSFLIPKRLRKFYERLKDELKRRSKGE